MQNPQPLHLSFIIYTLPWGGFNSSFTQYFISSPSGKYSFLLYKYFPKVKNLAIFLLKWKEKQKNFCRIIKFLKLKLKLQICPYFKKILCLFPFIYVDLTNYEKKVLYGIIKYPNVNDREIAQKLGIKQSTVAAIRKRLREESYYKIFAVPMLQNFGAEMMVVIHTNFNPVIPLEKRIEITEKRIEASEEIFFSMGEEDKGF